MLPFEIKGPNSYDVKTQPFKSKMDKPSANFISNTTREPIIEVKFFFSFAISSIFFL
jgi:hypothetical protein